MSQNASKSILQIPVALSFDKKFLPYASVTVFSLLAHGVSNYEVFCLVPVGDRDAAAYLPRLFQRFSSSIHIVELDAQFCQSWRSYRHVPNIAYNRLLISNVINRDKVIYLDCDVLVTRDLGDLYVQELGSHLVGGVFDKDASVACRIPRSSSDVYINSGVMLLNTKKMRDIDFAKRSKEVYVEFKEKIAWADQCIINKVCEDQKLNIDPKWNVMTHASLPGLEEKTFSESIGKGIIHFTGPVKPWMNWCDPWRRKLWDSYARFVLDSPADARIPITSIEQALYHIQTLDAREEFKVSGDLKSALIDAMMNKNVVR